MGQKENGRTTEIASAFLLTRDAIIRRGMIHLSVQDPLLAPIIRETGPMEISHRRRLDIFTSLVRSIIGQQVSTRAAHSIFKRVQKLFPRQRINPRDLLLLPEKSLRGAGLSANKLLSLRDLAAKTEAGVVPTFRQMAQLSDADLIERLTQVRGIGVWTVQMLLIFKLGRPDVLPTGDLGIVQGFRALLQMKKNPAKRTIERHAKKWQPYRSLASWYLWRVLEKHRATKALTP